MRRKSHTSFRSHINLNHLSYFKKETKSRSLKQYKNLKVINHVSYGSLSYHISMSRKRKKKKKTLFAFLNNLKIQMLFKIVYNAIINYIV